MSPIIDDLDWFQTSELRKTHPSVQPQTNFPRVSNCRTTRGIQQSAFSQTIYGVEPLRDFRASGLWDSGRLLHTTPQIPRTSNSRILANLQTRVLKHERSRLTLESGTLGDFSPGSLRTRFSQSVDPPNCREIYDSHSLAHRSEGWVLIFIIALHLMICA